MNRHRGRPRVRQEECRFQAWHALTISCILVLLGCAPDIPIDQPLDVSIFVLADTTIVKDMMALSDSCAQIDESGQESLENIVVRANGKFCCIDDRRDQFHELLANDCVGSHLGKSKQDHSNVLWEHKGIIHLSSTVRPFYLVDTTEPELTISPIRLRPQKGRYGHIVRIEVSVSDLERFKSFTAKNVSRRIAICLNDEVYAVPKVRHRFTGDCIPLDLDDEGLRKIKEITDGSKARGT